MRTAIAFGHVPAEALIAFSESLTKDEWATIDISPLEDAEHVPTKPVCDAPLCASWKLLLTGTIAELTAVRDGAGSAGECERVWNQKQTKLSTMIDMGNQEDDPAKRAAADRLHKALLQGAGKGQMNLTLHGKVDFGKMQAKAAAEGKAPADVALLGVGALLAEIVVATADLADAIGYGESKARPSARLRAATAECAAVFGAVANTIALVAKRGQPGEDRQRAARLLAPLETLVDRYPAEQPAPPVQQAAPAAPATNTPAAPATPATTENKAPSGS